MMKIKIFDSNSEIWNKKFYSFNEKSYNQSYEYGNFLKKSNWNCSRLYIEENNKILLIAQIFFRKYFGIYFIWIPGGPFGNIYEFEKILISFLKKKFHFFYIKFNSNDKLQIKKFKYFKKPLILNTSEQKMELEIHKNFNKNLSNFSKNWRHNFNRSKKQNLKFTSNKKINIDEIFDIYKSMTKIKNIKLQFSKVQLQNLIKLCKDSLICLECRNTKNKLLSIRIVGILNNFAFDILSATNTQGRKNYASYLIFGNLLDELSKKNIVKYDLSGVDFKKNIGVYNFKKGTGAKLIKCLGEWEYSNFPLLTFIITIFQLVRKI